MVQKSNEKQSVKAMRFLTDATALKKMFIGKDKTAKLLMNKLKKMNDNGAGLDMVVPSSQFLRAIWLAEDAKLKNIQKVLSYTDIMPSFADFKNKKACQDEILVIAKLLAGENGKK